MNINMQNVSVTFLMFFVASVLHQEWFWFSKFWILTDQAQFLFIETPDGLKLFINRNKWGIYEDLQGILLFTF